MGDVMNGSRSAARSDSDHFAQQIYTLRNGIQQQQQHQQQQQQQHQQQQQLITSSQGLYISGNGTLDSNRSSSLPSSSYPISLEVAGSRNGRNGGMDLVPDLSQARAPAYSSLPAQPYFQPPAPRPQAFNGLSIAPPQDRANASRPALGAAACSFDGAQVMAAEAAAAAAEPGGELEHFRRAFVELSRQNFMLRSRLNAVEQQLAMYEGGESAPKSSSAAADGDTKPGRSAGGKAQAPGAPGAAEKDPARRLARQNRREPPPAPAVRCGPRSLLPHESAARPCFRAAAVRGCGVRGDVAAQSAAAQSLAAVGCRFESCPASNPL